MLWLLLLILPHANAEISRSSELNCDFSQECRWRNDTNDGGEFVPSTNLEMDQYHKITAMRPNSDDQFVYTSALMGRQIALLVSDVVQCQLGGGNLKYWYWKTGAEVQLEVCIRQPPGSRETSSLRCYDGLSSTHAQQWIPRTIEMPPVSQPFEIVFRALFNAPLEIISLDDIAYDAILCESSSGGGSLGAGGGFGVDEPTLISNDFSYDSSTLSYPSAGRRRASAYDSPNYSLEKINAAARAVPSLRAAHFPSRCPLVDCDFVKSLCEWVTSVSDSDLLMASTPAGSLHNWRLAEGRVDNTLTGIPHSAANDSHLYAGGTARASDQFILSTRTPVVVAAESRLQFSVYLAGIHGRLRVCFDNLANCPFEISGASIDVSSRQWRTLHAQMPAGVHAVHFVADRLKKNYVIGLDDVRLLNVDGSAAQVCTETRRRH